MLEVLKTKEVCAKFNILTFENLITALKSENFLLVLDFLETDGSDCFIAETQDIPIGESIPF